MPSSPQYTPKRRFLLQLVLWGLFVVVCLAAAGLAHLKSGMWRIDLEPAQRLGGLELRLPTGWRVTREPMRLGEYYELQETDSPRRSIQIRALPLEGPSSPLEFMEQSGLLDVMTLTPDDVRKVERLTVPDGQGVIVHPTSGRPSFALMTFHDTAVLVQLVSNRTPSAEDEAILYHLSNSIRVIETPKLPPATTDYEI